QAYYQRGILNEGTGHADRAIDDFTKAAAVGARSAWRHLADIYMAKNEPGLSEDAFNKGIAAGDNTIYYRLGKLHEQMGKNAEAEKDFKQAAAIGENRAYYS